jgi:recombination protein RecT
MDGSTAAALSRPPTNLEIELAAYEPQIAAVLPAHIPVDRFRRIVLTALNREPALARADRRSLFTACIDCASDGLVPDGREAALVVFSTKDKRLNQYVDRVKYMPMIAGIRKRMRNSGEVTFADAQIIHEHDLFDYRLGDEPRIEHKPALTDRGEPIGAYAIIKLANGEVIREVMTLAEIDRARAASRAAKDGPWVAWWSEMARKTVLRRAAKAAPSSAELDTLLRRDDTPFEGEAPRLAAPERPRREDFLAMSSGPADREYEAALEDGSYRDAALEALGEAAE